MPAGLDGNPDPIRSPARDAVLEQIAATIARGRADGRVCVGVDGAAGTGKSTFADELAARLRARDGAVVRSTTDSFHNARAVRYRRGSTSAEGFYLDSHNLDAMRRELLEPFLAGQPFRVAVFDEPTDTPVECELQSAGPRAVLVVDGLFLHRPELRAYWLYSIYLEAQRRLDRSRAEAAKRIPADRLNGFVSRYVGGYRLYESECRPSSSATWVVDNDDFAAPLITNRTVA